MGSAEWGKQAGLKPRARIRAIATAGAEPVIMLTAPAPASKKALDARGHAVKDIDLWEINEAFAVVPLQTARKLGIDRRSHQRQRRRDRARPPARRDRRDPARHRARRARALEQVDRADHAVHRRRHGHRDDHRARLIAVGCASGRARAVWRARRPRDLARRARRIRTRRRRAGRSAASSATSAARSHHSSSTRSPSTATSLQRATLWQVPGNGARARSRRRPTRWS